MSSVRAFSAPELVPSSSSNNMELREDYARTECTLEGIATNVKLLLKLIQDHNGGSPKDNAERKSQRVAGMISIIDDVKSRIQKAQSTSKRRAELRRCNTELKPPRDRRSHEPITDEKERLRRQLNASFAAQKSLEIMCSSLGKEKEIMAAELSKKVQQMNGMEEDINDLKAQNDMLLEKVQAYASEHKEKKSGGAEMQGNIALQDRNKALSEQLLKSLEGYRSLKRKLKDAHDENKEIQATMEELEVEVQAGLQKSHGLKERMAANNEQADDVKEEISALEHIFKSLNMKVSKYRQKKAESD